MISIAEETAISPAPAAGEQVRKCVQPFPQDCLGGHDLAARANHEPVPFNGAGMILVSSAGQGDPEGGVGEVGGHYLCPLERPYR
jgi:hypothetical protein